MFPYTPSASKLLFIALFDTAFDTIVATLMPERNDFEAALAANPAGFLWELVNQLPTLQAEQVMLANEQFRDTLRRFLIKPKGEALSLTALNFAQRFLGEQNAGVPLRLERRRSE